MRGFIRDENVRKLIPKWLIDTLFGDLPNLNLKQIARNDVVKFIAT